MRCSKTRVKTFFDDIEKQGWSAVTGGEVEPSSGYFIRPTIIDRPPENSRIVVEEPLGKPGCLYLVAKFLDAMNMGAERGWDAEAEVSPSASLNCPMYAHIPLGALAICIIAVCVY
jgi:hypothetical protein